MKKEMLIILAGWLSVSIFSPLDSLAGSCCKSINIVGCAKSAGIEDVLEKMARSTRELKSYSCKVEYLFSQPLFDSKTLRKGELFYKKDGDKSRLRINFETIQQDDEPQAKNVEHYIFDGVWLTYIDYQTKEVKRFQQADANEPVDAFELAARNFPIIGFTDSNGLQENFEITLADENAEKGQIKLDLKVKEDSQYREDYERIEFWADVDTYLPRRIKAFTSEDDLYNIEFKDSKVNKKFDEKVFNYRIPKGFTESEVVPLEKKRKD